MSYNLDSLKYVAGILQSCLGQIWKFWNLKNLYLLINLFHVHRTVVLPFNQGTKGGDMKHQRETYKNTLVSIDHVLEQNMP